MDIIDAANAKAFAAIPIQKITLSIRFLYSEKIIIAAAANIIVSLSSMINGQKLSYFKSLKVVFKSSNCEIISKIPVIISSILILFSVVIFFLVLILILVIIGIFVVLKENRIKLFDNADL